MQISELIWLHGHNVGKKEKERLMLDKGTGKQSFHNPAALGCEVLILDIEYMSRVVVLWNVAE